MQSDLEDLIILLSKIARQPTATGIKAHWDGKRWTWTMDLVNPTADEWTPRELQHERCVRILKQNSSG